MKKITLFFAFVIATLTWQSQAQVLSEDFENGVPPANWTEVRTPASSNYGWAESSSGHSGKCAKFDSYYNHNGNVSVLSTPSVDITALSTPLLTFYYKNPTGGDFTVQISTDNGSTFTDLATGLTGQADWVKQTYDLSSYSSANLVIAFKGTSNYGSGDANIYLDDVTIQEPVPVFNLNIVPDCSNGQFSVDVNVTDFGIATSVTVSDDQGSATQQLSAPGTVTFGPYSSGTSVTITVTNDQNTSVASNDAISYYCPPDNDDCDNAIALTVNPDLNCGTVTSGTNVGATASSQADDGPGTPNHDVWFSFVATETSHVISLSNVTAVVGTSTDMVMVVYDGSAGCGSLTKIVASDPDSFVVSGLTVGTTYLLRVYGYYDSAQTNFDVCVGTLPPPPANDECDNAIALTVNSDTNCSTTTSATNVGATASSQSDDGPGTPNRDVWFSFVATGTSHIISLLNVTAVVGTSTDMAMVVYDGSAGCGSLTKIDESDPNSFIVSGLTVGTTYLLRVYGYSSAQTNFDVCVGTVPPPPANDDCANAQALTINGSAVSGYTYNASDLPDVCSGTLGDGVWYTFTGNGNDLTVQVDNVSAGFDGELQIFTGTCGSEVCVDHADSNLAGAGESITFTSTDGEVYLVVFGGYSNGHGGHGTFDISVSDPTAVADNQITGFNYYPNPVNHTLNLSAKDTIEMISIANIMGQEVLRMRPNTTQTQVDMSRLQNGVYFVKAQVNGQLTAFKVVKK